jgi:hypothetical protein
MAAKELENLASARVLKREPGEQAEFDGLITAGRTALRDARMTALSADGRFARAYAAAHSFALAALRWHGFRPDQKRYVVFQVLPHTLGASKELARVLGRCHQLRNLAEYEGRFEADERLTSELMEVATWLEKSVASLGKLP